MEVGVLDGDFSDQILQRCNPAELHLVDLHTERFERRFESEAARGRVIVRRGYSWEILSSCNSGQFDWIYIDASHDYESVKRDAHAAADKVRREGVLIFNDYTYMWPNSFRKYGVIEAVNELCLEQDWELVFLCLQGRGFYDVAIRRVGQTRL
jgi:predicted O-methyltransferase YrrM